MTEFNEFTPDAETLEALRTSAPEGPITLLNLLKFREPAGREAFGRYGAVSGPLVQQQGGEVVLAGPAGGVLAGKEDWDLVICVRFPSVDHFIGLVTHPEYQEKAVPLRPEALARTLWMPVFAAP